MILQVGGISTFLSIFQGIDGGIYSLKNSRLQRVQKRNVWAIFLTQQTKITNQLDWSNKRHGLLKQKLPSNKFGLACF